MTDIEQFERINSLLLSYGEILSSSQKEVLSAYYSYNLSISEIAEERNVSRAAVEDALKKGVKRLEELERALRINEKRDEILKITAKIKQNSDNLQSDIEDLERILTDGDSLNHNNTRICLFPDLIRQLYRRIL